MCVLSLQVYHYVTLLSQTQTKYMPSTKYILMAAEIEKEIDQETSLCLFRRIQILVPESLFALLAR